MPGVVEMKERRRNRLRHPYFNSSFLLTCLFVAACVYGQSQSGVDLRLYRQIGRPVQQLLSICVRGLAGGKSDSAR